MPRRDDVAVWKDASNALQIAAQKTLSAPESPLSRCHRTREKRGIELRMGTKLEDMFCSMWETNVCVFKAVMAD
jgi:urease accessory protein UreF